MKQQVATILGDLRKGHFLGSQIDRICEEWDFEKNELLGISHKNIDPYSEDVVGWRCNEYSHKWSTSIYERFSSWKNCPFCSGRELLVGFNDMGAKANKSILDEWHPTKNAGLTPQDVMWNSRIFIYWQCLEHGHEWKQFANSRLWLDEGCPVCAGTKVLSGYNDVASLPEYADAVAEWHPTKNGSKTPSKTVWGFTGKVWFQCLKNQSHEWSSTLKCRIGGGSGCLECAAERNLQEILQEVFNETSLVFSPARIPVHAKMLKAYGLVGSLRTEPVELDVLSYNKDLNLVIMFDDEFSHGVSSGKSTRCGAFSSDVAKTADLLNDGYRVIRIRESAREGKLKPLGTQYLVRNNLVKTPAFLDNYFSITYKSFDANSNIKDIVSTILKKKRNLFTLPF